MRNFSTIHDHLDLAIRTTYIHGAETFPEPVDVVFQPLTLGIGLKNLGKHAKGANKVKCSLALHTFPNPLIHPVRKSKHRFHSLFCLHHKIN